MPLTFGEAQKLITGAHAKAGQLEIRITAAVVDESGLLIALGRMDGAAALTPQVAEAKAVGAAVLHRDGAGLADLAKDRPGFFSVADRLARVPIVPGLGSVLIKRDGKVLGAVGVSGGRPSHTTRTSRLRLKLPMSPSCRSNAVREAVASRSAIPSARVSSTWPRKRIVRCRFSGGVQRKSGARWAHSCK